MNHLHGAMIRILVNDNRHCECHLDPLGLREGLALGYIEVVSDPIIEHKVYGLTKLGRRELKRVF